MRCGETGDRGDSRDKGQETGDRKQEVRVTRFQGHQVTRRDKIEKGYKKLKVWEKADELAYQIYLETKKFPKDETYGVVSQLRRAAISIPTNIVEGTGRQGKNELRQFLNIALGSLAETEYLLEFCFRLGYLSESDYNRLESLRKDTGGLLWNFHKSLNR